MSSPISDKNFDDSKSSKRKIVWVSFLPIGIFKFWDHYNLFFDGLKSLKLWVRYSDNIEYYSKKSVKHRCFMMLLCSTMLRHKKMIQNIPLTMIEWMFSIRSSSEMLHSVVLISVLELQLRNFDRVTLLLHVIDVISCAIQMDIS